MKIDLQSIDKTQFMVHPHVLCGEEVHLVQPQHIGAKWDDDNKIFRSSVWDSNGELISAGFPKFTNWGEKPEVFPVPESLINTSIVEKLDGSLLIVSKWKGQHILRTRGTVDASKLDNGSELEVFKVTNKEILELNDDEDTWKFSLLFEWTSPAQRIVLNYGEESDWCLVGAIYHDAYHLFTQNELDELARTFKCKRPTTYQFNNTADLLNTVDLWKGKEGVCIYSNGGQMIHKVKSAWYLALHHMKSELSSFDKIIDVWIAMNMPDYKKFYDTVALQFDFELANQIRGDISRICEGYKEVQKIIFGMNLFVNERCHVLGDVKDKKIRGQMARVVLSSYGKTNRGSFVFKLLDGKGLATDDLKKLLFQVLK